MRTIRFLAFAAAGVLTGTALAGCGGEAEDKAPSSRSIAVKATDTACEVSAAQVPSGTISFTVTNDGTKVTEFYVYGAGDKVVGEVENIAPGLSRELRVELTAGKYETACKPGMNGKGIRKTLTVTGSSGSKPANAALAAAVDSYRQYVRGETDALVAKTREFVDAVKGGDMAKAKALYPVARTHWEHIEPVAEAFGDLDPKIDGREDDLDAGAEFTGFHRLEKDLWVGGEVSKSGRIADRLMADVEEIAERAKAEKLSALRIANGAKALLDEVATGKITGEEERYSHTDLWDFNANVEGCQAVIDALRPVLSGRAPELLARIDTAFADVKSALGAHRRGDGWKLHSELSQAQLKHLSDVINALAEPVSKVAAAVSR